MGLLEQEIKELRSLAKSVLSGTISQDTAGLTLSVYNQISKRETLIYNLSQLQARYGEKGTKLPKTMNLIGNGTAIDVHEEDETVVVCPEKGGKCVSMGDCLDYSGDQKHIDACQKCDNFSLSRKYHD